MAEKAPQSGFWIVTTHAGTAWVAIPFLFCLLASVVLGKLHDPAGCWLFAFVLFVGSIVGTLLSVSNLKKTASYSGWSKLVNYSAVAFCFALGGTFTLLMSYRLAAGRTEILTFVLALVPLCVAGVAAFYRITASRFDEFDIDDRASAPREGLPW